MANSTLNRRGSTGIEIVLWCLGLIPGLVYTLWRNADPAYTGPTPGTIGRPVQIALAVALVVAGAGLLLA